MHILKKHWFIHIFMRLFKVNSKIMVNRNIACRCGLYKTVRNTIIILDRNNFTFPSLSIKMSIKSWEKLLESIVAFSLHFFHFYLYRLGEEFRWIISSRSNCYNMSFVLNHYSAPVFGCFILQDEMQFTRFVNL